MARPKKLVPSYQLHKSTGQARTYIDGRDFYLGPYGSDESRRRFGELIALRQSGLPLESKSVTEDDRGPSIAEVILAFMHHAETHYVKNGNRMTARTLQLGSNFKQNAATRRTNRYWRTQIVGRLSRRLIFRFHSRSLLRRHCHQDSANPKDDRQRGAFPLR